MPRPAQVRVGEELPGRTIHLDRVDLVRYAGAGGDLNPIHWDEHAAAAAGLPDVIAHGMLTMGAAVQVVVDWAGDPAAIIAYGARMTGMVPVPHDGGADVEVRGVVTAVDQQAGTATVELTATCDGRKVLGRGLTTVRLD